MILEETPDKVRITLDDFAKITKCLGIKYNLSTWRIHAKGGKLENSIYEDNICSIWVDIDIYNAVLRKNQGCKQCVKLKTTLDNIKTLAEQ